MTRDRAYSPFLDWLKCLGMLLIVYGHFAGWAPAGRLFPIYLKQIGVACFLFAAGCSLARDTRDRWRVVYNRLFEVYLFGLACALILTAAYPVTGELQLSNYYPFIAGANILFDNFPANPTTWYLGTYAHIVVLWALLLSRRRISWGAIAVLLPAEIVVRALLMQHAGLYIAYQAFTNWITVFLLGMWYGQRADLAPAVARPRGWVALLALLAGVALWIRAASTFGLDNSFPFMRWPGEGLAGALGISAMVSGLYVAMTWLIYASVRGWHAPAPVRFVARNTLIIFLGHMPLYYALTPAVEAWTDSRPLRSLTYAAASVVGLGCLSEALRRVLRPRELRARILA